MVISGVSGISVTAARNLEEMAAESKASVARLLRQSFSSSPAQRRTFCSLQGGRITFDGKPCKKEASTCETLSLRAHLTRARDRYPTPPPDSTPSARTPA